MALIRIKELRRKMKLSQEEFADYLNVSQATVSSWECGNSDPDLNMLIKIADYFEVSLDFMMGRGENRSYHLDLIGEGFLEAVRVEYYKRHLDHHRKVK